MSEGVKADEWRREKRKDGAGDEGSAKDRRLPFILRLLLSQGRRMCLPSQEPPFSWTLSCPCPPQGTVTLQEREAREERAFLSCKRRKGALQSFWRLLLTLSVLYDQHYTALGTTKIKINTTASWGIWICFQSYNISKVLPVNSLAASGKWAVYLSKRGITDDWNGNIRTKRYIPSHLLYLYVSINLLNLWLLAFDHRSTFPQLTKRRFHTVVHWWH